MWKLWIFSIAYLIVSVLISFSQYRAGFPLSWAPAFTGVLLQLNTVLFQFDRTSRTAAMPLLFFVGILVAGFLTSFIPWGDPIIMRDGKAQEAGWLANPFTIDKVYYYLTPIRQDVTVTLDDRTVHVRAYTKTVNDKSMFYYEHYGTPQALADSIAGQVDEAISIVGHTDHGASNRQIVATANHEILTLWGLEKILLVLPEDSIAFAWKKN